MNILKYIIPLMIVGAIFVLVSTYKNKVAYLKLENYKLHTKIEQQKAIIQNLKDNVEICNIYTNIIKDTGVNIEKDGNETNSSNYIIDYDKWVQ